jgi:hypothetical protein
MPRARKKKKKAPAQKLKQPQFIKASDFIRDIAEQIRDKMTLKELTEATANRLAEIYGKPIPLSTSTVSAIAKSREIRLRGARGEPADAQRQLLLELEAKTKVALQALAELYRTTRHPMPDYLAVLATNDWEGK